MQPKALCARFKSWILVFVFKDYMLRYIFLIKYILGPEVKLKKTNFIQKTVVKQCVGYNNLRLI